MFTLILVLFCQLTYAQDSVTFTPSPSPSPSAIGSCSSACETWKSGLAAQAVITCGASPTPNSSPTPVSNTSGTYSSYTDCYNALKQSFGGDLAPKCIAYFDYQDAQTLDQIGFAAFGAAAGACAVACFTSGTTFGAAQAACIGAGLAATAMDIADTVKLSKDDQNAAGVLDSYGYITAAGEAGGTAVEAYQGAQNLKNAAMEYKYGPKAGPELPPSAETKIMKDPNSCAMAVLFTVVASVKAGEIWGELPKGQAAICSSISNLQSFATYVAPNSLTPPVVVSGNGGSQSAQAQSMPSSPNTTGNTNPGGQGSPQTIDPQTSSATAAQGPLSPLQGTLGNINGQNPDPLNSLYGSSQNPSSSPAEAMNAAFPNMPEQAKALIDKVRDEVGKGNLGLGGIQSAALGGSESKKPTYANAISFNSKNQGSKSSVLDFKEIKKQAPLVGCMTTDPFHEGCTLSIFKIVEARIQTFNEYKDTDGDSWQTPVSRASYGLPALQRPTENTKKGL